MAGSDDLDGGDYGGEDVKKGAWTPEEDNLLTRLISQHGTKNWSIVAAGIKGRSGKSCRLRCGAAARGSGGHCTLPAGTAPAAEGGRTTVNELPGVLDRRLCRPKRNGRGALAA